MCYERNFFDWKGFEQIEIVESVKSGSLLRPTIEAGECNIEIGQLMKRCWLEDPNERPDFTDIRQIMRRINKYDIHLWNDDNYRE